MSLDMPARAGVPAAAPADPAAESELEFHWVEVVVVAAAMTLGVVFASSIAVLLHLA